MLKPRPRPCPSCPYRRDVPSAIWAPEEYDKLPGYDGETWEQSTGVFCCHSSPDFLCAGWVGCHDMAENLAIRIHHDELDLDAVHNYVSPVPLFSSGQEAAEHGKRDYEHPSDAAITQSVKFTMAQRAKMKKQSGIV